MSTLLPIEKTAKVSNPKVKDATKVKTSSTKVKDAPKSKVKDAPKSKVKDAPKKNDKVLFLKEGVKSGELHKAKINTNKEVKKDMKSFSTIKKFCIANDKSFLSSFKCLNFDELTPPNLTPYLTEKQDLSTKSNGWSSWLFMSIVKKYYENKK